MGSATIRQIKEFRNSLVPARNAGPEFLKNTDNTKSR
jgi:hypothetical protein